MRTHKTDIWRLETWRDLSCIPVCGTVPTQPQTHTHTRASLAKCSFRWLVAFNQPLIWICTRQTGSCISIIATLSRPRWKIRSCDESVAEPMMMRTMMRCCIVTAGSDSEDNQGAAIIVILSCLLFVTPGMMMMMMMIVIWGAQATALELEPLWQVTWLLCCFLAVHWNYLLCCKDTNLRLVGQQEPLVKVFLRDLFSVLLPFALGN